MLSNELSMGASPVVRVVSEEMVSVGRPDRGATVMHDRRELERCFAFDRVFDDRSCQEEVFRETSGDLIESVVRGVNATIFAYGATGSGKTFTMFGSDFTDGIVVFAFQELYQRLEGVGGVKGRAPRIEIQFIEIYNEVIRDLLTGSKKALDLREDTQRGPCVAGAQSLCPPSLETLVGVLQACNRRRTQEPTRANVTSSRSHAVIQVEVHNISQRRSRSSSGASHPVTLLSKFSMVDLAGSERAQATENVGVRLREGAKINSSLLALGNVINAIVANPKGYIPFRDSKLTRLLKDSLGGRCRTSILATISPSSSQYNETINTLVYADRAKQIRVNPTQNVQRAGKGQVVADYQAIISDLSAQVKQLQARERERSPPRELRWEGEARNRPARGSKRASMRGGRRPLPAEFRHSTATAEDRFDEYKSLLQEAFHNRTVLKQSLVTTQNEYNGLLQVYMGESGSGEAASDVGSSSFSSLPPHQEIVRAIHTAEKTIDHLNRELARSDRRIGDIRSSFEDLVDPVEGDRFLGLLGYNESLALHNSHLEEENLRLMAELARFRELSGADSSVLLSDPAPPEPSPFAPEERRTTVVFPPLVPDPRTPAFVAPDASIENPASPERSLLSPNPLRGDVGGENGASVLPEKDRESLLRQYLV